VSDSAAAGGAADGAGPDDEVQRTAAWLAELLGRPVPAGRLQLGAPGGGGWSNDTWIARLDGEQRPLAVVRLQPQRRSMFPDYDLGRQVRVLQALGPVSDVPTPPVLGADLAGARLGRPAFVMGHVAGRVPADDRPTFVEAGWLYDATPAEQRTLYDDLLRTLAAVHRVEPAPVGLTELLTPGRHGAMAAVEDLRPIWAYDPGPELATVIEDAFAHVTATVPLGDPSPRTLLWGDARPANVLCEADRFAVAALLDWELAASGPPELDVAWLLEMNWMRAEGAGLAPLPGFGDEAATVARYEHWSGRSLRPLGWYRTFSALKVAVFMYRYLRAMVHAGRMPERHRIFTDNVSTRRLAALLDAGS